MLDGKSSSNTLLKVDVEKTRQFKEGGITAAKLKTDGFVIIETENRGTVVGKAEEVKPWYPK